MEPISLQQHLLLKLSEAIPAPVYYKAPDLTYLGCNQAFERFFQKKREELIGKDIFYLYSHSPEKAQKVQNQDLEFLTSPDLEYIYEREIQSPDGSMHYFIITKAKFFQPDGSLGGIAAVMFDNTEFKNTEAKLNQEKIYLRTLMDAIPEPIIYKDNQLKYIDCNKAFEIFSAHQKEEMIGKTAFDIFPEDRASFINTNDTNFLSATRERETYEAKLTVPPVDGEQRDFLVSRAKFQHSDGSLGGFVTTVFDITERKILERKLIQTKEETEKLYKDLLYKNTQLLSGIEYASRIQRSIFVEQDAIVEHFKDAFILFLPKDVVSGDFYWFARKEDTLLIAAIDCTGHGVPGALMTILGHNFLNQIVYEQNVTRPDVMLSMLDIKVVEALQRRDPQQQISDGMELSLCAINLQTRSLQFAGAKRPLWIMRAGNLQPVLGSKFSIGGKTPKQEKIFSLHEHAIQEGDIFYLFTDGYCDQLSENPSQRFMTKNLAALISEIHALPLAEQKQRLLQANLQWRGSKMQTDDILMMGMKVI
ncbi:MAG: PAS domain-containing protein [Verrucomicrobiota bacterium]